MVGLFKRWASNASEYKRLQKELSEIYSEIGVNFMHLHPEITKYLVSVARDQGASGAQAQLTKISEKIVNEFPDLTEDEIKKKLILTLEELNKSNRVWE